MYEHLRGDLRNQIPKFQNPAGPITIYGNQYITYGAGFQMPFNPQADLLQAIKKDQDRKTDNVGNPIPDLSVNLENYIQQDQKRQQQEYEAKLFSNTQASGDGGGSGDGKDSKFKQFLNKGVNSAKNALVQNASQIANMGMNAAYSWATSGIEQGGLMNSVNGASNFIRSIPGVGEKASQLIGTVTTGLNVINKLGGTYVDKYQANKEVVAKMGGSYGGWVDLAQRAQDATGKTYGPFSGGAGKARALGRNAQNQENKIASINNTYQDQVAMTMNDANYTRYLFNQNGGWNPSLMRSSKFGSKLERIRRITSKQPEEPIEEFAEDLWEPQLFKKGGTIEDNIEEDIFLEDSWEPQITELKEGGNLSDKQNETKEETNQKNIIPDGALHKEKHHMENAEDLTKKGIPVIDNDGVQQAEIERDEIVFTLEVTKKLEELYHKYYDQETSKKDDLAIEAGKILVHEILYNTIDKTGLISKCKEGGKLNET